LENGGSVALALPGRSTQDAGPYQRPISDLKVTYLIFPGSGGAVNDAPDLTQITSRCLSLSNGLGGIGEGFELHQWRDIIAERRAIRDSVELVSAAKQMLASVDSREAAARKSLAQSAEMLSEAKTALTKAQAAGSGRSA